MEPKPLSVDQIDEADWAKIIAIDLTGPMVCMKYQLEQMIAAEAGGVIVNTVSVAGIVSESDSGPYVAAKTDVIGLTKSTAIETRITVFASTPSHRVDGGATLRWLMPPDQTRAG